MHPTLRPLLCTAAAAAALVGSCAGPSVTSDEQHALDIDRVAPRPTARMASRSGESLDKIGSGYWIFQRKCLECHEARVPHDPADPNWHPVMQGMTWNAGLSTAEQDAVLVYLRAAVL